MIILPDDNSSEIIFNNLSQFHDAEIPVDNFVAANVDLLHFWNENVTWCWVKNQTRCQSICPYSPFDRIMDLEIMNLSI